MSLYGLKEALRILSSYASWGLRQTQVIFRPLVIFCLLKESPRTMPVVWEIALAEEVEFNLQEVVRKRKSKEGGMT